MADAKISALVELAATPADDDVLAIVDTSAVETKKITPLNLLGNAVKGPGAATDNAIARFDLATGKLIQNSTVLIDDAGNITAINSATMVEDGWIGIGAALERIAFDGVGNAILFLDTVSVYFGDADTATTIYISDGTTNYVGIDVPALAADWTLTLPIDDGDAGDYLKTDGAGNTSWDLPVGTGDVVGPAGATDEAIARYDLATGKLIQDSGVFIDDVGNLKIRYNNELRFYDNGNYVGFEAPALAADQIWILPTADGVANQVLTTSGGGAGVLSWTSPPGTGDVVGPAGATDNAIVRYDLATGKLVQDSNILIDDTDNITGVASITIDEDGWVGIGAALERIVFDGTEGDINLMGCDVGIGVAPKTKFTVEGTITLKEQAAADGDTAAYGQIWVKTATPNELWFTDDAGTDYQLTPLSEASGLTIDSTPDTDDTAEGIFTSLTAGENIAFPNVCYQNADGEIYLADADLVAKAPAICMALETKGDGQACSVLMIGFVRDDDWTWTVGGEIFLSETAGGMTQTAPSDTGDQVQVLGVATHADRIWFNPQLVVVEHA